MKVLLYEGGLKVVEKSGIGKAILHQREALSREGIPWTGKHREDWEIIQLNTVFPDSYLKGKLAKWRGKKVVYYGHSTMEDFRNSFKGSNLLAPLFKRWIKKCYEVGDVIITPTEYSKEILEGYGITKPIINLTNGIDLKNYKKSMEGGARFRRKYNLDKDQKTIISVGHQIERKGIIEFVELAKRMPQYTFIWFGYTSPALLTDEIRSALKTELPNLTFAGYVNKEELMDAYSGSDLFLFLTKEETEGIVMLEAMAMEIPVLVRDIPIYSKWLPDGEAVYKGCDLCDFENQISQILRGKKKDLTKNALHIVEKNDITQVGERLHTIYNALLKSEGERDENINYNRLVQTSH